MAVGAGRRCQRAHPRVCGENEGRAALIFTMLGSSPRVRGKRPGSGTSAHYVGLIPACAGKTCLLIDRLVLSAAHPRVCGENMSIGAGDLIGEGSSPRVRGKQMASYLDCAANGLIPACAGKTLNDLEF